MPKLRRTQVTPNNPQDNSIATNHAEINNTASCNTNEPSITEKVRHSFENFVSGARDFSISEFLGIEATPQAAGPDVEISIEIDATPEEVWEILTKDGNFKKMFAKGAFGIPGIMKMEFHQPADKSAQFKAGNFHYAQVGFGGMLPVGTTKETYLEVNPNENFRYKVEDYPFVFDPIVNSGEGNIRLERTEDGKTKVTFGYKFDQVQYESGIADKLADAAFAGATTLWQGNMENALGELQRLAESPELNQE